LARSKGDLLGERAARALDDIAFDAAPQPVRVDDQPAIMRDGEFARPHLAIAPIDLDLGDDRDHRTRALRVGDAAPGQCVAGAVGPRRWARLPPGMLGRGLDDGDVARRLQIAQAEGELRGAGGDETISIGKATEGARLLRCARKDLRADGIARMRGAQWRGAVEQGRDRLPGQPLVRETVEFSEHAKAFN